MKKKVFIFYVLGFIKCLDFLTAVSGYSKISLSETLLIDSLLTSFIQIHFVYCIVCFTEILTALVTN